MKPNDITPPPTDDPKANNAAGAGCMARLVRDSFTLRAAWDGSRPGCIALGHPFDRPVLMARVVVNIKGWRLHPHRVATDGKVFRLDVFLGDGRTLRLLLPPDFPCEDLPMPERYPSPPSGLAKALGFAPRDYSRAVTDADRLILDLYTNVKRMRPYQRGRKAITGLGL